MAIRGKPVTQAAAGKNPMSRIAFSACVGTTVEFYDFFIFGTAAALVFNKVFFPALGSAAGSMASLATFGVAFFVRPLGSILFGHFGDRIGRKTTLVASLLLMGVATLAIGLLPTAATIGVAAPILLVALRMVQGIALGGEWAGAALLTGEHAPAHQRGLYAMFPQLGPSIALVLVGGTFLTTSWTMTDQQFIDYGWRIPFMASPVLVLFGLYVRLKIAETPAFEKLCATKTIAHVPFLEVVKRQPREVLLGAGSMTMMLAFFHIGATYMTSYGTKTLGLPRTTVLMIGVGAGFALGVTTILSALYSDRFGRRWVTALAAAVAVPWSLALFPLVNLGTPLALALGTCVTMGIMGVGYGPLGAQLPELFRSRYRYTGAGVAYSLGTVFGGAMTPFISEWLLDSYGSSAIGLYLALTSLVSLACIAALRETKGAVLTDDGDADMAVQSAPITSIAATVDDPLLRQAGTSL